MPYEYINFDLTIAADRWTRQSFFRGWRTIMADDPRWAPPPLPWLRRTLTGRGHAHMRRLAPTFLHVQAVRRRVASRSDGDFGVGYGLSTSVFEETVAAAVLLTDPRVEDRTAYLALPHIVNDEACLDRLLESVVDVADAVLEHVGKANQYRQRHAPTLQSVDQHGEVDPPVRLLRGVHEQVARLGDGKVAVAPVTHAIRVRRVRRSELRPGL